jgi:hypothetical protein
MASSEINDIFKSILKMYFKLNITQEKAINLIGDAELNAFIDDENRDERYNATAKRALIEKIKPVFREIVEGGIYICFISLMCHWYRQKRFEVPLSVEALRHYKSISFEVIWKFFQLNMKGDEFWMNQISAINSNRAKIAFDNIKNAIRSKKPTTPKAKDVMWDKLFETTIELHTSAYHLNLETRNLCINPYSKVYKKAIGEVRDTFNYFLIEASKITEIFFG